MTATVAPTSTTDSVRGNKQQKVRMRIYCHIPDDPSTRRFGRSISPCIYPDRAIGDGTEVHVLVNQESLADSALTIHICRWSICSVDCGYSRAAP